MFSKHEIFEKNSIWLLIGTVIVISIGGMVEIIPLFRQETTIEPIKGVRPYTPLELVGQNIYIREGCNLCHSQQIRPLRDEVERYGHYSLAAESMYDHPFQWGSKRTGPDLARVGGKYSDEWHKQHLIKPQNVVPESVMPTYRFLLDKAVSFDHIKDDLTALSMAGVPYTKDMIDNAKNDGMTQAQADDEYCTALKDRYSQKIICRDFDGQKNTVSEMDALIAYLQVLGTMAELKDYDPSLNTAQGKE